MSLVDKILTVSPWATPQIETDTKNAMESSNFFIISLIDDFYYLILTQGGSVIQFMPPLVGHLQ
jgi:hypothetical protein